MQEPTNDAKIDAYERGHQDAADLVGSWDKENFDEPHVVIHGAISLLLGVAFDMADNKEQALVLLGSAIMCGLKISEEIEPR